MSHPQFYQLTIEKSEKERKKKKKEREREVKANLLFQALNDSPQFGW